jgi:mevalonate kinase
MDDMQFRSNGKLMISGEYLVLAGASALAVPVIYGQTLEVTTSPTKTPGLSWLAKENDKPWFETNLSIEQLEQLDIHNKLSPSIPSYNKYALKQSIRRAQSQKIPTDPVVPFQNEHRHDSHHEHQYVRQTLISILLQAKALNTKFLSGNYHWSVMTQMDFDRQWGLGSSSTLLSNIAWWADIDPYTLLFNTLGGSGYDIACARSLTPIIYRYKGVKSMPKIEQVTFKPAFYDHLFFIFTGKKQSSAKSLQGFDAEKVDSLLVKRISQITESMLLTNSISVFMEMMFEHEHIISQAIGHMPVQLENYPDFDGAVKSLGAWGGDFIMAASNKDKEYVVNYFKSKGLQLIIPFNEMVLHK